MTGKMIAPMITKVQIHTSYPLIIRYDYPQQLNYKMLARWDT